MKISFSILRSYISLFICFFLAQNIHAQEKPIDTLDNKSVSDIYGIFYSFLESGDTVKAFDISKYFVKRQESIKPIDYLNLLDGYILKIESDFSNKEKYLDTIVELSHNLENDIYYPANGYFTIGTELFNRKKFIEALDYLIKSYELSKTSGNYLIEFQSLSTIGIIKLERINDEKEAIKLFLECSRIYKDEYKHTLKENYALLNFNLAEAYRKTNNLDSSKYYTQRGLNYTIQNNLNFLKDYFIYEKGINDYLSKDYNGAIQNLQSSYNSLLKSNDFANLIVANFYLGKSYQALNKIEKRNYHLNMVDSLHKKNKIFIPQVRDYYLELKNKYKTEKNQEKELYYLNKVLEIDSIYLKEYRVINETFNRKFNHLDLQNDKIELNKKIELQSKNHTLKTIFFVLLSLLLIGVALYFYFHSLNQKKRFDRILKKIESEKLKRDSITKQIISDEKEKEILDKLNLFEKENGFLKKNILIRDFARNVLKSNDKYLRSVLKKYKNKSFPQYLNDLRIEYCIEKLKNDFVFRKYTMETLSSEFGFNNVTSFYNAFEKFTGSSPYFFINQLNKSKDS